MWLSNFIPISTNLMHLATSFYIQIVVAEAIE